MSNTRYFLKESLLHLKENLVLNTSLLQSPIRLPTSGYLREELDVPVSPSGQLNETVLYEDPRNAPSKYYLPCYKAATEQTAAGRTQYCIKLEERAPGWVLRIRLAKYPAAEIELAAREAQELPHRFEVVLRYSLAGSGGVQKELVFGDKTSSADAGIQAELQLGSLAERDEVYVALTQPESGAVLIVRRTFSVAIPIPPPAVRPKPIGPIPGPPLFPKVPGQGTGAWKPMIRSAADLPKGKLTIKNLPIKATTGRLSVPLKSAIDRETLEIHLPESGGAASPTRYRKVDLTLDNNFPFVFPASLHGYIFGGISPTSDLPGLIRHQVLRGNVFHSYYQESSRRHLFYYLPDAFKLARQPDFPYQPFLSVGFISDDGSLEASKATLAYAAAPYVDSERLDAAALSLKSQVSGDFPDGVDRPEFQPLLADADRLSFRLALPGAAEGLFQPRKGAVVNLKAGIIDSLTLSFPELQAVFDALMGSGAAVLMNGEVEVSLYDQNIQIAEKVPFTARMNDLAGDLFEYRHDPDPETGGVRVTLRNAIESPLRIDRLNVTLVVNGAESASELRGIALPVEQLAPGGELAFTLVPESKLADGAAIEVIVDRDGITVMPDREAIWNAIQESYTAQYKQMITVKTLPAIFKLPEGSREEDRLSEILVELKQGAGRSVSVELMPETLEAHVSLQFPFSDVILGRENSGEYVYRVTAIRLSGETQTDWKKKIGDRLFILQDDVV